MDANTLKAIQVLALRSVEDPTFEDFFERVCRWYSKSFSVPLPDVESIPDEKILRAYFEEHYYELATSDSDEDFAKYKKLRETVLGLFDGSLDEVEEVKEKEDDEWAKQIEEDLRKEIAAQKAAQEQSERNLNDIPNDLPESGSVMFDDEVPED
jgi:hypothetical protein